MIAPHVITIVAIVYVVAATIYLASQMKKVMSIWPGLSGFSSNRGPSGWRRYTLEVIDSIVHYNEVQATKLFYPKNREAGPEAEPTIVHEYFVHGLLDTMYTKEGGLKEFQDFPTRIQRVIRTYDDNFAKKRSLFLSIHSSYPIFSRDQQLLVPSIVIAELGVSNGKYPPRDEILPTTPSIKNFVEALVRVFMASSKLGIGRKQRSEVRINYFQDNIFIFSNFSGASISEEDQKI